MKCPLFILSDRRVQMGEETEIGDCIQELCAWWIVEREVCAILSLAYRVGVIAEVMKSHRVPGLPPGGGK